MTHLDRKELRKPDTFLRETTSVFDYVHHHLSTIGTAIVVLFFAGLGLSLWSSYRERKLNDAQSALYSAKVAFTKDQEAIRKAGRDWLSEIPGGPNLKPDLEKIKALAEKNNGSVVGYEAYMILGEAYAKFANEAPSNEGKNSAFVEALSYFSTAERSAPSKLLRALTLQAMARAEEDLNKYDLAIEHWQKAIKELPKGMTSEAQFGLARSYEAKGDATKASDLYSGIARDFPNTMNAKMAELAKGSLKLDKVKK